MARHSIHFTPRGATTFHNVRKDGGNLPLLLLNTGETKRLALDFSEMLDSGETLSSATVTATGVTASISTSGSTATLTLSGPSSWGEAIVTATLSSGDVVKTTIRVRENASTYDPTEIAYSL